MTFGTQIKKKVLKDFSVFLVQQELLALLTNMFMIVHYYL